MTRIVIELRPGDGPMTGTFLDEGKRDPMPFSGWMELLALLEAARARTVRQVAEQDQT
jgi:hypothetical protein